MMPIATYGCFTSMLVLAAVPICAAEELQWSELHQLPDEHGFGGPIAGVHNGALLVAGGANFPDGPPWPVDDRPAGSKVWHDRIFVLEQGSEGWIDAGRLPARLAYAPAISTSEGIYVLGGETFDAKNYPTAAVLLLRWDSKARRVTVTENALPPLPAACHYHAAAIIRDTILRNRFPCEARIQPKTRPKVILVNQLE